MNNIAEGIIDIAIRHGVDPRDFSLVAFGAAGPMLLPALLDLRACERVIVPPHPGLFSALGLLSSDLVYSDSRSAYTVLGARGGRAGRRDLRGDGGAAARRASAPAGRASTFAAASTAASSARAGRRRSSRCPTARSTPTRSTEMIERFHDGLRAAQRQPLRRAAGAGRDLPRAGSSCPPTRSSTRDVDGRRRQRADPGRDDRRCATSAEEPSRRAEYDRDDAARRRRASTARRSSARRCRPRSCARPGGRRSARYGEIVIERRG